MLASFLHESFFVIGRLFPLEPTPFSKMKIMLDFKVLKLISFT